jgi:hypothetical protein
MARYSFRKNIDDPRADETAALLGVVPTGQPTLERDSDEIRTITTFDFPGVTLTAGQRVRLQRLVDTMGWGEAE